MIDLMPTIERILLNKCNDLSTMPKVVARMINTKETNLKRALQYLYYNQINFDFLIKYLADYLTGKEEKFSRLNKMLYERDCPVQVNLDRSIIEVNVVNLTVESPYKLIRKFIKYGFLTFNIYGMTEESDYEFVQKLNNDYEFNNFNQVRSNDPVTDFYLNFSFNWIDYDEFVDKKNWLMIIKSSKEEVANYVPHLVNKNYFFYYYESSSLTCSNSSILKLDVSKVVIE